MKHNYKGFTLVELLIVVSIVAILSTVVVVGYTNMVPKSRDARRQTDINQIVKAFQMYKVENGRYPDTGGALVCLGLDSATSCWEGLAGFATPPVGNTAVNSALVSSLDPIPLDPLSTSANRVHNAYVYNSSGTVYTDCTGPAASDCTTLNSVAFIGISFDDDRNGNGFAEGNPYCQSFSYKWGSFDAGNNSTHCSDGLCRSCGIVLP